MVRSNSEDNVKLMYVPFLLFTSVLCIVRHTRDMFPIFGTLSALTALVGCGTGDFAIQRSVRKVGTLQAMFAIATIGTIGFLSFVWYRIPALLQNQTALVILLGAVLLAFTNILSGLGGQASDPLTAIWFIHTTIALLLFCLFLWQKTLAGHCQTDSASLAAVAGSRRTRQPCVGRIHYCGNDPADFRHHGNF